MIESAEQLLSGLMGDGPLMGLVGSYCFDDGTTAPAITVLDSNQVVTGVERIEGLEIVVSRVPAGSTAPDLTDGFVRSKVWTITLTEYPGGPPAAARAASERITELIPGGGYDVAEEADPDGLSGEQGITITIPAYLGFADAPPPVPPGPTPPEIPASENAGRGAGIETADQLYEGLTSDPILMDLVGSYEFDDGTSEPSITILSSNQVVSGLREIRGLEVIVSRTPSSTTSPDLTGGYLRSRVWRVALIQYPGGDYGAAQAAAERITARIPGSEYSNVGSPDNDGIAGDAQIGVTIPAYLWFADAPLPPTNDGGGGGGTPGEIGSLTDVNDTQRVHGSILVFDADTRTFVASNRWTTVNLCDGGTFTVGPPVQPPPDPNTFF